MAGFLSSNPYLPSPASQQIVPVQGSDCLPCSTLRSALTQCGTCGGGNQPNPCTCGGTPQPCAPGQTLNSCGCCNPASCPTGESAPPCAPGMVIDPQTGCCRGGTCPTGEHAQPCAAGETIDPRTGCCQPAQIGPQCQCPTGDYNLPLGTACPAGTSEDPASPPNCNCCKPSQGQCTIPGDHPPPCLAGETTDSQGCCAKCPSGMTSPPCGAGYQPDPQSGCCAPMAVEACFVCPGGLPELAAALAGQPNNCYLTAENFLPSGMMPAQLSP